MCCMLWELNEVARKLVPGKPLGLPSLDLPTHMVGMAYFWTYYTDSPHLELVKQLSFPILL